MHIREWLKSAAVAAGGGAMAAISAILMDPTKFNLSNGLKDELLIALQGAVVGVGALFIRSPLGTKLMKALAEARQQSSDDKALLAQLQAELKELKQKASDSPAREIRGSKPS